MLKFYPVLPIIRNGSNTHWDLLELNEKVQDDDWHFGKKIAKGGWAWLALLQTVKILCSIIFNT